MPATLNPQKPFAESPLVGTSGANTGVTGESNTGIGVKGLSLPAAPNPGVDVKTTTPEVANDGVYGEGNNGVHGVSNDSGSGVLGESAVGGPGVTGSSTKNSGVVGTTTSQLADFAGVHGEGSGQSAGVSGTGSGAGAGVSGSNTNPSPNILGTDSAGVSGISAKGRGVMGTSTVDAGVFGSSTTGAGVKGMSSQDVGVVGIGATNGIQATTTSATEAAVKATGTVAGEFDGNVTITGKLSVTGDVTANDVTANDVTANDVILSGADCAEDFDVAGDVQLEPGTVVVFDDAGAISQSALPYNKRVAGVVSGAGKYRPGVILGRPGASHEGRVPVALIGRVYCKVDATYAPIGVGDMLTTSPTSGCAMKATDPGMAFGAVIGKALSSIEDGQGLIPILVTLQ